MRKCEYQKKYSPTLGKHVYKHVYGEGVYDVLSGLRRKLFSKAVKESASRMAKKTASRMAKKAGEKVANKAGDKIVKLLQANQTRSNQDPLTDYEINERVQRLLSGSGKIKS